MVDAGGEGYRLTYSIGRWASEWQLQREPIQTGTKVWESRRRITSQTNNPWFMIEDGAAQEEAGRVWFGALGWSGNWRLSIEKMPYQQVRVTGGYNPFDFAAVLKPGQSLSTYGGFSEQGFGGASRMLHRFERESIFSQRKRHARRTCSRVRRSGLKSRYWSNSACRVP